MKKNYFLLLSFILLFVCSSVSASQKIDRTTTPNTRTFDEEVIVDGSITQNSGESVVSNPANVYTVTNATDLYNITVAMGTAGTFTVTSDTILNINAVGNFITNVNYNITGASFELNMSDAALMVYTGTSTFFTSYNSSTSMKDVNVVANTPGTQLFDITGLSQTLQFFSPRRCIFTYFDLGTIDYIGILGRGVLFVDWKDTLEITNVTNVLFNEIASNQPSFVPNAKPMMSINTSSGDPLANINVVTAGGYVLPFDSFVRLEPDISNNASVLFSNVTMSSGTLFDTSTNTGEFTAVADESISAQAVASVTDSSGIARFNWTPGATVYVGQEVQVSGYVTNTAYNGTHIVTAAGVGYFEISSIAFGSNEATGSFDSDSVTITSTAHGLSNLDGVTLDTSLAKDYDGGATIYNVLTDTFQVNREWTTTKTGTWSTKGLNQKDPRVVLTTSPSFEESNYIGFAHIQKNPIANATTISTTDVYQDMNLTGTTDSITGFALVGVGITRVTSAGHGLENNQNIEIEGTTNYNGTYRIFSKATDTFDIAIDFNGNDATGTWYSRLLEDDSNERFKVTNRANAELTYIGYETFRGNLHYSATVLKTGNTETYLFSGAVNGEVAQGAPFKERAVTTSAGVLDVTVPVTLEYGDKVKPQVASVNTTNSLLIKGIIINITK